jgi:hypothetical protein
MKQQLTAVEWFANRISHGGLVSKKQFDELLEQAKEMEDQQKVEFALRAYIEKLSPGKDFIEIVNSMRTFKQNNNESK